MADVFPVTAPLYYDAAGNLREAAGVIVVPDTTYRDAAGNVRGAIGVNIVGGGGGGLPPNQGIVTDGEVITAQGGQLVTVMVDNNVVNLFVRPNPFFEPFTVTVADDGDNLMGYFNTAGQPLIGSISNEPIDGYVVRQCYVSVNGDFYLSIDGTSPLVGQLSGALVGINGEDFNIPEGGAETVYDGGVWKSSAGITGVPVWTVGQQVPIVIIP